MYDVIVIGAGPAGSFTAGRLAAAGHSVLVLEQKDSIGEKLCCTGIVGRDCVREFSIGNDIILQRAYSARLFSPSGKQVRAWRPDPQAYILDRPVFDRLLAKQAMSAGARYLLSATAESVVISGDSVTVDYSQWGGKSSQQAKAVVLAAGFGSPLAGKLGLARITDFAMGAQAEVGVFNLEETEVYVGRKIAPGFFGWMAPGVYGRARVGLISRRQPGEHLKKLLAELAAQGKITSDDVEIHYGGIPLRPLKRTSGDRLLVVGDAAGQVKPTSGGGIYYGLLCSRIAADVLHRALKDNDLSAKSLSEYDRLWHQKLDAEMRTGRWFRRIYERMSDRQLDWLFHALGDHHIVRDLGETKELSFDYHGKVILKLVGLLLKSLFTPARHK